MVFHLKEYRVDRQACIWHKGLYQLPHSQQKVICVTAEAGNETYWEAAIFVVAGQLRDLAGDQPRASHPLGLHSAAEIHPQFLVL